MQPGTVLRNAALIASIGLVQVALVVGLTAGHPKRLSPAQKRAERADVGGPFPLELRSPQVVAGSSQRVLVSLRRPSLAKLNAKTPQSPARQRAYVRSLHREVRALMSALTAKGVRFGRPVLFARVWSGFAATIATDDLPAVQALGLRVEPVSRFYPAQVPADEAPAVRPLPTVAKRFGRVAVLDAFPRSKKLIDEVGRSGDRGSSTAARAGERLVAVVEAELPTAVVDRVRVAGSQALETGKFQVFGTTDQLLAGLERSVDPDENGDASDAYRVALTGLSAPYSGFDRSTVADAVDAAAELGTLVVAPAGNGGDPDGPFGSIGAPGAARTALTVGALDADGEVAEASSRGPTYSLRAKPDLATAGGARTAAGSAWGTAIAAARVAGVAAALRAERPSLAPAEAAGALIGTAEPRGEPAGDGGGDPLLESARVTPVIAAPSQLTLGPRQVVRVRLRSLARKPVPFRAGPARGLRIRNEGNGLIVVRARAEEASGRIQAGPVKIPYRVVTDTPPAPPVGAPKVTRRKGKPSGVRFVAGSIKRGARGTSVVPVGNLVLLLTGPTRRVLTPPGGARDLLPGEYAYTLTDAVRGQLQPGTYRFELRAKGTAGGATVTRRSRRFKVA